ncbi:MAG: hypothetical protein LBC12_03980 [Nitrososphaerota archaeon]|nr:hypothetical protein [Nitrososphaerota archaeon]
MRKVRFVDDHPCLCLIILLNLPLSAEKPHSEKLRLKYCFKKETEDSTIRPKISRHALILRNFFLGIMRVLTK